MSKPKAICVRELYVDGANDVEGDVNIDNAIFYKHDVSKTANPLITAPTYLHEWYKACQQEAQIEECHGDTEKVPWIKAGMESVREFILDKINYDIATNTITTESEGEDE